MKYYPPKSLRECLIIALLLLPILHAMSDTPPGHLEEALKQLPNTQRFIEILALAPELKHPKQAVPTTWFVPTDAAFEDLPKEQLARLLDRSATTERAAFLRHHMIPGVILETDFPLIHRLKTLLGPDLIVAVNADGVTVNRVGVELPAIVGEGFRLYLIERVLIGVGAP